MTTHVCHVALAREMTCWNCDEWRRALNPSDIVCYGPYPSWSSILWALNPSDLVCVMVRPLQNCPNALLINRGVHPSETMMHSPLFQISPYFLQIFGLWGKLSQFYLFPTNFIRRNFSWLFFSHRPQISNFPPILPVSIHFPPLFRENYYSPLLLQIFLPVLDKFTCFYILYVYFVSPLLWPWCICASPNARTGCPWENVCRPHNKFV